MNISDYFAGIAEELVVYAPSSAVGQPSPQTPLPAAGEGLKDTDSETSLLNKNNATYPSPAGGRGTSRPAPGPGEGEISRTVLTTVLVTIITILVLVSPTLTPAQDVTRTIKRTAQFADINDPDNELAVYNINGSAIIEGYDGEVIQVTARQELEGTGREIERARQELELVVEEDGNRVLVYLDAPFIEVRKRDGGISYRISRRDDDGYEFLYDITIRVPRAAHVRASTINQGKVAVDKIFGRVSASNINGDVELTGIGDGGPTLSFQVLNGNVYVKRIES